MTDFRPLGGWRQGEGPAYRRLAGALRAAIDRGDYPAGSRLPAERNLAKALSVSRTTVVGAYEELRQDGWVESRRGSGSRVRRQARPDSSSRRETLTSQAFRRNTVFRGLIESNGSTIEFLGAHLPGAVEFLEEAIGHAGSDLAGWLAHPGYSALGLDPLRAKIAEHIGRSGLPTRPEEVLVTHGAQQAIVLATQLYVQGNDGVVLEDPTYVGAIDVFAAAGARLLPIPMTGEGMRLDALREILTRQAPRLAYFMPTFHNPLGTVESAESRREIVRLCEERGVPVVEDHTLADLAIDDDAPPPPLAAYARGGPVLTVGSLSKLIWGGLRVGWVRASEEIIERLARLKVMADLGNSVVSQVVAARLLSRVGEIRQARRRLLTERLELAALELGRRLPDWTWRRPAGGLSLWVRLPRGGAAEFVEVALRHGVSLVAGSTCSPRAAHPEFLRIPFVQEPEVLREGIRRLGEAWSVYSPAARPERASLDVLV